MDDGPELSDVIAQLRASLSKAQKDGEGHNLRFDIEDVEIELQVAVTKEKSGGGGIKFGSSGVIYRIGLPYEPPRQDAMMDTANSTNG